MRAVGAFFLSKSRFENFSDGVFAIAATLLVLEFRLPDLSSAPTDATQTHALLGLWPQYLVFLTSFATIGIMWLNHHAQFRHIDKITHGMAIANLFLLLLICFLPFPTEVLAQLGLTRPAVVFYGLTLSVTAIAYSALHQQLLAAHPQLPHRLTAWNLVGLLLYPVGTVIAYFYPLGGIFTFALLALFYMLPQNVARGSLRP